MLTGVSDSLFEGNESFTVAAAFGKGVIPAGSAAGVVIDDNVASISLSLTTRTFHETGIDNKAILFAFFQNVVPDGVGTAVTVPLTFIDGATPATYNVDYSASLNVVVDKDMVVGSIALTGIPDNETEPDEDFSVAVSNSAQIVGVNTVSATILDASIKNVTLSLSKNSFHEMGSFNSAIVYAILTGAPSTDVLVPVTYTGRALKGDDFTGEDTITVSANYSIGSITLTGISDNLVEGDETFHVKMTPTAGYYGVNAVTATIKDDTKPTISLGLSTSEFHETAPDNTADLIAAIANVASEGLASPLSVLLTFRVPPCAASTTLRSRPSPSLWTTRPGRSP